jgi:hypothetical protein
MTTQLTPTERLLLALLQLQPHSTACSLFEASGSRTSKHVRASLRTLVLAGRVVVDTDSGTARYALPTEREDENGN